MLRAGLLGLAAAALFIMLATVRLDRQGLYYDELHQAVASFDYIGHHSPGFNYEFLGFPVLNMTYSGAIKSNVYGLYLRFIHPKFGVVSWRMLGILFVAAGLVGFYLAAGDALPLGAGVVFGGLLLSDVSLLLATRHDWGPVALNLSFRLIIAGIWVAAASKGLSRAQAFAAAGLVGLATFEKLTAVVLLVPLGLLLVTTGRRDGRVRGAVATGLFLGFLPLAVVNAASYVMSGRFVSLQDVMTRRPLNLSALLKYADEFLSLGMGRSLRTWILGAAQDAWWGRAEVLLLTLLLLLAAGATFVRRRDASPTLRGAGALVGAYVAIAIGLILLPRKTNVHHWVMGAPFHYAAIALLLAGLWPRASCPQGRLLPRMLAGATVGLLLALRLANLASTEVALAAGRASETYSPSLSRLGMFAARNASGAAFVSADWGTYTAVYCLTNGEDDVSYESFWADDPAARMDAITRETRKDVLYLAVRGLPQFAAQADAAVRHMLAAPDWRETPVEDELRNLAPLQVRRFVRRATPRER